MGIPQFGKANGDSRVVRWESGLSYGQGLAVLGEGLFESVEGHQQFSECAVNESDGHMLFPMDEESDVQCLAQVMFGFFRIV